MNTQIEVTKSGRPALWEEGGGFTNTGEATIVAGPGGERLRPYFVRQQGDLACQSHALLPIEVGSWVISAEFHNKAEGDGFLIEVWQIAAIHRDEASTKPVLVLRLEAKYDGTVWSDSFFAEGTPFLQDAVIAARQKAQCYHCRKAHFALTR